MLQEESREPNPHTHTYTHATVGDYSRFCLLIGHKIETEPRERVEVCQDGGSGENIFRIIRGIMWRMLSVILHFQDHMGVIWTVSCFDVIVVLLAPRNRARDVYPEISVGIPAQIVRVSPFCVGHPPRAGCTHAKRRCVWMFTVISHWIPSWNSQVAVAVCSQESDTDNRLNLLHLLSVNRHFCPLCRLNFCNYFIIRKYL